MAPTRSPNDFDKVYSRIDAVTQAGSGIVIGGNNLAPSLRKKFIKTANKNKIGSTAVVFPIVNPSELRNISKFTKRMHEQHREVTMAKLFDEGFSYVHMLDVDYRQVVPVLYGETHLVDTERHYAVIGDVHGCIDELEALLAKLANQDLFLVFAGDLVDRGPGSLEVLALVKSYCDEYDQTGTVASAGFTGTAIVDSNHDNKLCRYFKREFGYMNSKTKIKPGKSLSKTIERVQTEMNPAEIAETIQWLMTFPTHLVLNGGDLVVSHAGIKHSRVGRSSKKVRDQTMYGQTLDERVPINPESGRGGWRRRVPVAEYWDESYVQVHGHEVTEDHMPHMTAVSAGGKVVRVDAGACFGGCLCAYRTDTDSFEIVRSNKDYYPR